jgi:hypothetical protein
VSPIGEAGVILSADFIEFKQCDGLLVGANGQERTEKGMIRP